MDNNFIHNTDSLNSLSETELINLSLKDLKFFPKINFICNILHLAAISVLPSLFSLN